MIVVSLSALLVGCGPLFPDPADTATPGKLGKARFGYDCAGIFGVCKGVADNAIAAGGSKTTVHVYVNDYRDVFQTLSSTNPAVVTFAVDDEGIHATSGIAGTADLQLFRADGSLIDRGRGHGGRQWSPARPMQQLRWRSRSSPSRAFNRLPPFL